MKKKKSKFRAVKAVKAEEAPVIKFDKLGSDDDCFGKMNDPEAPECKRCGDCEICVIVQNQLNGLKKPKKAKNGTKRNSK